MKRIKSDRERDIERYDKLVSEYEGMHAVLTSLAGQAAKKAKDIEQSKKNEKDAAKEIDDHMSKMKGDMLNLINKN